MNKLYIYSSKTRALLRRTRSCYRNLFNHVHLQYCGSYYVYYSVRAYQWLYGIQPQLEDKYMWDAAIWK